MAAVPDVPQPPTLRLVPSPPPDAVATLLVPEPARPALGSPSTHRPLVGRRRECGALESLVDGALAGRSGVLVLRGEAGIGKTALLDHVRDHAAGCRVARAAAVESEMDMAFAGLHQLCGPLLEPLARVPPRQQHAVGVVFGVRAGGAQVALMVGLSVVGVLSQVAAPEPLICLVDAVDSFDTGSVNAL